MSKVTILYSILFLLFTSCHVNQRLVNLSHLHHLYEDLNVSDHKIGSQWIYCEAPAYRLVADEDEGFTCVDDVARSLVLYCREMRRHPSKAYLQKIESLSNFILYMQADNGYFYNFMFYDGTINKSHKNSVPIVAFWTWRAYWALTEVLLVDDNELDLKKEKCRVVVKQLEEKIFDICNTLSGTQNFDGINLPKCISAIGSDQMAEMLKGMANRYLDDPNNILKATIQNIGQQIVLTQMGSANQVPYYAFLSWQNYWHAWGNSQSYALLKAGKAINDSKMIEAAMNEINYFYQYQLKLGFTSGFKLIRDHNDTPQMVEENTYSQIAYGISPMILASTEAWHLTQKEVYADLAFSLAAWYFGENKAMVAMYDINTGRGFDGINGQDRFNKNAGAESTIESLLAMQAIEQLCKEKAKYKRFIKDHVFNKLKATN